MFTDWKSYLYLYFQLKSTQSKRNNVKKTVVFWGASLFLKTYLKFFGKQENVIGIVDKDPQKWGTEFCGYKVYSPEELGFLKPNFVIFTIKHYYATIYPQVKSFIEESFPKITILPVIFDPLSLRRKQGPYIRKIEKALNKNKKARLFVDTGLSSLINTMSIIKDFDNKNYDNYLLVYSGTVSESFKKFTKKFVNKEYFKRIFFVDGISNDIGVFYLKNYDFLSNFESIYTSAQPTFPIWERHSNINLIEEGVSSYVIFDNLDYTNVQNFYMSNYLKNMEYKPPLEHQKLILLDRNNIRKTIKEIRAKNKINYSFLRSENQVLLLSQYIYSDFMEIDDQVVFYKKHVDKLIKSGYSVLFKTHPRINDEVILRLKEFYKEESGFKIFPENIKYPVELIIDDLDLKAIVTSMSGGAFNCSHLFGIPCYGFGAKLALENHEVENIKTYAKIFLANMPHVSELYK